MIQTRAEELRLNGASTQPDIAKPKPKGAPSKLKPAEVSIELPPLDEDESRLKLKVKLLRERSTDDAVLRSFK